MKEYFTDFDTEIIVPGIKKISDPVLKKFVLDCQDANYTGTLSKKWRIELNECRSNFYTYYRNYYCLSKKMQLDTRIELLFETLCTHFDKIIMKSSILNKEITYLTWPQN